MNIYRELMDYTFKSNQELLKLISHIFNSTNAIVLSLMELLEDKKIISNEDCERLEVLVTKYQQQLEKDWEEEIEKDEQQERLVNSN